MKDEKPKTIGEYVNSKRGEESFSDDFLLILTFIMAFGNFGNIDRERLSRLEGKVEVIEKLLK